MHRNMWGYVVIDVQGIARYFYQVFDSFIIDMILEEVVLSHLALISQANSTHSSM